MVHGLVIVSVTILVKGLVNSHGLDFSHGLCSGFGTGLGHCIVKGHKFLGSPFRCADDSIISDKVT